MIVHPGRGWSVCPGAAGRFPDCMIVPDCMITGMAGRHGNVRWSSSGGTLRVVAWGTVSRTDSRTVRPVDLTGVLRRTLLVGPDGRRDTSSEVVWLQGPSLYVDVRRPAGTPRDPDDDRAWARAHEGFAGRCTRTADGVTHWERAVDVRAPGPFPDAGLLTRDGADVVERGVHVPYTERWAPEPVPPGAPVAGALLRAVDDGRAGVLVRAGDRFGWACGRGPDDDPADPLTAHVAVGRITGAGWIVELATLPRLEGRDLRPHRDAAGLGTDARTWQVLDTEVVGGHDPLNLLTNSTPLTKE